MPNKSPYELLKPIEPNAIECLRQLFLDGPTWDGNIVSKAGRGELFELGYARRVNGWTFITEEGMEVAVYSGMPEAKEKRDNQRRRLK